MGMYTESFKLQNSTFMHMFLLGMVCDAFRIQILFVPYE